MFMIKRFQDKLTTRYMGREMKYYQMTESTNQDAWHLYEEEYIKGSVVLTDRQYKGRGRHGSHWFSTKDTSLTFSIIYEVTLPMEKLGLLALLSAVAVATGIRVSTGFGPAVKWPNDIIVNHRKLCGILVETRRAEDKTIVVTGIGLNVNERKIDFEGDLKATATSINIETGNKTIREYLLAQILYHFEYYLENMRQVIPQWRFLCAHKNQKIFFHQGKNIIEGIFLDLDEYGHALIETNGKVETYSGNSIIL